MRAMVGGNTYPACEGGVLQVLRDKLFVAVEETGEDERGDGGANETEIESEDFEYFENIGSWPHLKYVLTYALCRASPSARSPLKLGQ